MKLGNRKLKAFTLVELLMVLAVIALLTSIMMPTLHKVKELARAVTCRTNLKQIGLAHANYMVENDGYVVPIYEQPGEYDHWPWFRFLRAGGYLPTPTTGVWAGAYTKENSVIKCPDIFQYPSSHAYWGYNVSYAANSRWVASDFPWYYQGTYRYQRLTDPSDYISFIDYYSVDPAYKWNHLTFTNSCMPHIDYRHLSRANWLAWDGHVESVCEETAWDDAWRWKHAYKR